MSQPLETPAPHPVKSGHVTWSHGDITVAQRAGCNGHRSAIVWLTGLSASGKSTIARALERELFERGMQVFVLEGDNLRHGLNRNLGFSPEDRSENIRRAAEVAKLLADAGVIVIAAFISPYRADRAAAREIARAGGHPFVEVFVNAPLEVCEARDPKHLYQKARAGQIKEFTGVSAPYEPPDAPELELRTDRQTPEECVAQTVGLLVGIVCSGGL
jgi:adenylyl-sulfate kinase